MLIASVQKKIKAHKTFKGTSFLLKRKGSAGSNWPKNTECAFSVMMQTTFVVLFHNDAQFIWLFCSIIMKTSFGCSVNINTKYVGLLFVFRFEQLGAHPCWFALQK